MESAAGPPVIIATFTGEIAAPTTSTTTTATATAAAADHSSASAGASQLALVVSRRYQYLLDKSTPFVLYRWIAFTVIAIIYFLRVFLLQGFFVVTYGLGIYMLNLLIGFLSPRVDPGIEDGPILPTRRTDEFRPFVRRLPEFKFWYSMTKAFCIAFALTFFWIFDVPVYWPILLFYFVILFTLTMKRQILHMIQYNYVPFSSGKQQYERKKESTSESAILLPED